MALFVAEVQVHQQYVARLQMNAEAEGAGSGVGLLRAVAALAAAQRGGVFSC